MLSCASVSLSTVSEKDTGKTEVWKIRGIKYNLHKCKQRKHSQHQVSPTKKAQGMTKPIVSCFMVEQEAEAWDRGNPQGREHVIIITASTAEPRPPLTCCRGSTNTQQKEKLPASVVPLPGFGMGLLYLTQSSANRPPPQLLTTTSSNVNLLLPSPSIPSPRFIFFMAPIHP